MTKFTETEIAKIVSFLKEKWGGRICPLCQSGGWIVQDSCFQLMTYNSGGIVLGGPVIPVIPVTCNNCSNTVLINAILAGVVNPNDKPSTESAEDKPKIGTNK